jgi:hypothetical protein
VKNPGRGPSLDEEQPRIARMNTDRAYPDRHPERQRGICSSPSTVKSRSLVAALLGMTYR